MAKIKPFQAVRPSQSHYQEIAALPYDVYSSEEAREYVKDKPLSFLKIDRAETFFDEQMNPYSQEVYEKARDFLGEMIAKEYFSQDESPFFYIYELMMDGRSQKGLVACTSVDEYLNNQIKKHELTRADKEQDRISHVDICDANTGPIFLTYRAQSTVDGLIESWIESHKPVNDYTSEDGILHRVWVLDDEQINEGIVEAFETIESLYIADGHHRAASAVKVAQKRRAENPDFTGNEEFNYFLSVIFPDEQLKIMDYNRVVKDLGGLTITEFLGKVKEKFQIIQERKDPIKPTQKGTFGMYLGESWYLLEAKAGSYNHMDPVLSLDVSILQLNLLAPILGIGDPRTDKRIDFVGGIRGLEELVRRVNEDMEVAFAMVPTSIEELMSIADADELMPPKSTWFEPKLRSGLFVHLLK